MIQLLVSKRTYPLLATCMLVLGFTCVSCSTGPTKEEIVAKQAEIKKTEERRKEQKAVAEKKAKIAAKKKAVEEEDSMQMKSITVVDSPKAEKLAEPQPAPMDTSSNLSLELPTAPNTYLITMGQKDKTHPFFGVGDARGFSLNGIQGNYVIARRNHPVTFQVRTGAMHDFYISTSAQGWGAAAYRAGVSGQFTYNGNVTFTPNLNTPDVLFYACRNHNSMGGKIIIVDENADIAAVKQQMEAERIAQLAKHKDVVVAGVDPKKVKQKIAYVGMLLQFKGKSLAPDQKSLVEEKLNSAKMLEKQGDMAGSLALAQEAAALFQKKSKEAGPSKEELAEQKEGFNDLLVTLEAFIDSHLASFKQAKEEGRKTVSYDSDAVGSLIVEAKGQAEKQQYEAAGKNIKKAERMVTRALNQMLNEQTIVYDLNFKTPADEFKYEVNRYKGYAELIPVAIEVKKPSEGSIKYMEGYRKKAEFFKEKAHEAAEAERWEEAIVVIKDATIEIRRGLRVLGVSM